MTTDIAQILQEKAGLSEEQSHEVANVILEHIKSKVPAEFQGFLTPILGGSATADGQPAAAEQGGLGGLMSAATGLFGSHNS